ncbi:hypothetical protein [Auraticoccus monumenti]|uniref:S-adenosylmethionine-diacylglycerol 3-amino-3-carboxypropyl transferase n=1 Tax=Auraticoccus monumenti TaxID=675864 RepID=A0A1G7EHA3_9ACTN|nr:hypothetical protein [Auraticoccus monumenti]SDE63021.1 S-adenosylmethionine-diacylglycerol 3-amino-3-carboxypropyl transferase [Auraticoccus monumenti]
MSAPPVTPWQGGRLVRFGPPRVLFGRSYEDQRIELEAFGAPGRVCVIAASGEVAAACAAAGHRVTAVDINPHQLAYARRRLGEGESVRGSAESLMTAGRSMLRPVAPGWRLRRLWPVLQTAGPEEALAYWRRHLDTRVVRWLVAGALRPGTFAARILTKEFGRFIPRRFDDILRARLARGLGRHGMRDNRFAWRLLSGEEQPGWRLPDVDPDQISWVARDVAGHLESVPVGHYDAVALSNVLDGAPPEYGARLKVAVRHAVRPGGAVVLRSLAEPAPGDSGLAADDAALIWGSVTTTWGS